MKISLITETFPPEVNGVAMTLQRLVNGLRDRGHHVEVVRPKQNEADHPHTENNIAHVTVRGLPLPGYEGLKFGLPATRFLRKRWSLDRPDIVHIATEGPLGWSAYFAARKLGIKISSSFHTNFHTYGDHYGLSFLNKIALAYLRAFHNRTAVTFVPSLDIRDQLGDARFKNLEILGRGVDTTLFNPSRRDPELRRSWGADEFTSVAIYVGRVASEKNIPLTVEAWQEMKTYLPTLKLVIVGDGPLREELEKEHKDIIFAGMQRGVDLARHYASADVFPFASASETFGNVVTEAMGSGLVVLAYDYAAPQQYIKDGQNGYLTPLENRHAYLEKARQVAKDHQEWTAIRQAATETAKAISWSAIFDTFESHLVRIVQDSEKSSDSYNSV